MRLPDTPTVGRAMRQEGPSAHLRMLAFERVSVRYGEPRYDWKVNPEGRLPWLQRACFAVLKWCRAVTNEWSLASLHIQNIDIEPDVFMQSLFDRLDDVQEFFDHRPTVLYIGARQLRELQGIALSDPDRDVEGAFYFMSQYRDGGKALDLRVNVIPWFDGILAI